MPSNYWTEALASRTTRRRAILGTGGAALGAAFLAACGSSGSDAKNGTSSDGSKLVATVADTTKQAKRGGTIKDRVTADPPTYDVQQAIAPLNFTARHVYSTLVAEKPGYLG